MSHTNEQQQQAVKELLGQMTPDEVAATCLEALRRWWRSRQDGQDVFALHGDLGSNFVVIVGETKDQTVDAHSWKEPFAYDQREPWMQEVIEFLWWMQRAGLVVPLIDNCVETGGYPIRMRVTRAGGRLLSSASEEVLLPDALKRLRTRCRELPDEVLVHLADARSCLEHGLARPAVVLLGLAYETLIEQIVDRLIASEELEQKTKSEKAAKKIAALKRMFEARKDSEEKFSSLRALDFADHLRQRRNDGSHSRPIYDFSDLSEVHELFASALRHLPVLSRSS